MSDLEEIYLCAVRYALGRKTYIVELVSEHLIKKLPDLSAKCKALIVNDIEQCTDYGHKMDEDCWMKLLENLIKLK